MSESLEKRIKKEFAVAVNLCHANNFKIKLNNFAEVQGMIEMVLMPGIVQVFAEMWSEFPVKDESIWKKAPDWVREDVREWKRKWSGK